MYSLGLILAHNLAKVPLGAKGSISPLDAYLTHTLENAGIYVVGIAEFTSSGADNTLIKGNVVDAGDTYTLQVSLENQGVSENNRVTFEQINPNIGLKSGLFALTEGIGDGGNILIKTPLLEVNGGIINAESLGTGNGGSINLNVGELMQLNNAMISVGSSGTGKAGDINIVAPSFVANESQVASESQSGTGGDILLQVDNNLILQNNSQISTSAGVESKGGGDGGNITIESQFLIQSGNSDINANAFTGKGGSIKINADSVIQSFNSEITASSELGIDGTVEIQTLENDLNSELVNLQDKLQVSSDQIVSGCSGVGENTFTNVGRGGIP